MRKHLKKQYGFEKFRHYQKDIIKDIINKKDSIVIFPTGGGKSLCYQFPATFLSKKTVVISPLISLMSDQEKNLQSKGIKAVCLNGETNNSVRSNRSLLRESKTIISPKIREASVIYCTPEYIVNNIYVFKSIVESICLFAIDEAHCLSEWGHDFRPSYRELKILKETFPDIPITALTATATPSVLEDIFEGLGLDEVNQYQMETNRDNLSIHIREKSEDILSDLDINKDEEESTIIYTQTRKNAEKIYNLLISNGVKAGCYHAGLSVEKKCVTHNLFVRDEINVIVATICFGMGIDKPDIRKVINYGSPCNLETYYQEIGRAGRDGMPATVIMYYGNSDYNTNRFLVTKGQNSHNRIKLLDTFQRYIGNSSVCRQVLIDYYFENGNLSGNISNDGKCGKCDNCLGVSNRDINLLTDVFNESQLIVGLVGSLSVNYGINKLIQILRGTLSKNRTNKYYGKGELMSVEWWKKLINALVLEEYLSKESYSYYTVIGLGRKDLNDINELKIYIGDNKTKSYRNNKYYKIRSHLSKLNGVAPYMIINDKILSYIMSKKPKNISELYSIDGISNDFICKYGQYFLLNNVEREKKKVPQSVSKNNLKNSKTTEESWVLYKGGKTVEEISEIRRLKRITIESHIVNKFTEDIKNIDRKRMGINDNMLKRVKEAVRIVSMERLRSSGETLRLRPIKEYLDMDGIRERVSYFQIRTCLLL